MHVVLNRREGLFQARAGGGSKTKAFALRKFPTMRKAREAAENWADAMEKLYPPVERRGMLQSNNQSRIAGVSFSWEGCRPILRIACFDRRFTRSVLKFPNPMKAVQAACALRVKHGLPGGTADQIEQAAIALHEFVRKGPR
jgi:hypothetical protein